MISYIDLVEYTKRKHVDWNTDLFDVLRGFFNQYSPQQTPSPTPSIQQELNWKVPEVLTTFSSPADGEYTTIDLLNSLST